MLALFLPLTAWWLWPLSAVVRTHSTYFAADVPLMVADYYLSVWIMAWDAHALVTAPWGLFHANAFYPSTLSLAYAEHLLGYVPLFAPAFWLTGNAVFAWNVVLFATYPLCALAMYALVRRWTGPPAAAVGAFFYAFLLARYEAPAHLQMLGVPYLPVIVLSTEWWLASARRCAALGLAGALLVQLLCSVYVAFAVAFAYSAYLPLALWRWRRRLGRRRILGLIAAVGVAGAGFVAASMPYLVLARLGYIASYIGGGDVVAAPPGLSPELNAGAVWHYLRGQSVGPVGYTLGLAALLPPWRTQRWPRLLGALLVVVGIVAALGMGIPVRGHVIWLPYRWLSTWLPGLASIRTPVKLAVIAELGFALLAGLGFARLVDPLPPGAAWSGALLTMVLALAAYGPRPPLPIHRESVGPSIPAAYRWLAVHGEGRALLEEPRPGIAEAARRMYFSTVHWLPIVDGYSGYPPDTASYVHDLARDLPDDAALQRLVDTVDVGWLLVHRDALPPVAASAWSRSLPDGLERAGEWGPDLLIRVTRPVRDDRRTRLLSTRETVRGVPLAPLGERCPGELRLRMPPPDPWPPLALVPIEIDVHNADARPWPGLGFVPRHLVRLAVSLAPAGQPEPAARPIALPDDVPAGGTVTVAFSQGSWPMSGDYVLTANLVQVGDGPLSRCGVAALRVPVRVTVAAR